MADVSAEAVTGLGIPLPSYGRALYFDVHVACCPYRATLHPET